MLLAVQAMTPNAWAEHFDSSRQAVSKHIQVLVECGLPTQEPKGREILYQLEDGKLNEAQPVSTWVNTFAESEGATTVRNEIAFADLAQLESLIQMGFKEGYTMGLGNLEELLARLQKKAK